MRQETINEIERFTETIIERLDKTAHQLAEVRESIIAAYMDWEDRMNVINQRRDDLDAEEREASRTKARLLQEATDRQLIIIQGISDAKPPLPRLSSETESVLALVSNNRRKQQANGEP